MCSHSLHVKRLSTRFTGTKSGLAGRRVFKAPEALRDCKDLRVPKDPRDRKGLKGLKGPKDLRESRWATLTSTLPAPIQL